jgi:diguanylate cyclase (GGDEF)-like protein
VHPEDVTAVERHLVTAAGKPGTATLGARFRHADGSWRDLEVIADNRLSDPTVNGIVLSMRDVTHRKALEDELRHQAFHDALTGLANRALFEDRLAHALAGARRHRRPVAVLFLDLDDFKTINDSLGHVSGDDLLSAAAMRIGTIVRAADTAARLGGDEFAILVEIMDDDDDVEAIANRILEVLATPFDIAGRQLRVSASVGVAISDGSIDVQELLRNADTAMYAAKASGKNTLQMFEEGMHLRVLDRLELTGEMRIALESEQFVLEYQPIVELDTGKIRGAEALVRWEHPTRGRLEPMQFIGLAEETGLIVPLGEWILRTACGQAAKWTRRVSAQTPLQINVNVSTRQLHDPGFPAIVADVLSETGLEPGRLVLEITESLLPDDADATVAQLEQLKGVGVRIAVDDFGTGYSALSRLQRFPIDVVKIDRSFIEGMENDPGKVQLVQGIVNLGESLQLEIVAEGIEERAQADRLRGMRPSLAQGFLFSRPIRPEELTELLRTGVPLVGSPPCKPLSAA